MIEANPTNLPDIAIINYKTSRPVSLDVARWIKEHYPGIKVVINTQFSHRIPVSKLQQIGIEGVIIKAIHSYHEIISALHVVYNGGCFYAENPPVSQ
ncbi:hypothetical protein [Paraflavitalea speifideaquila]|uniref:hypothetical protein n=1 Tax=Paraflavitalea speifideaquila TaxID=3076558 RepID=UPI0028E4F2C9|nr:hypothetical protein [Paraflavitalea speifideiaquila]